MWQVLFVHVFTKTNQLVYILSPKVYQMIRFDFRYAHRFGGIVNNLLPRIDGTKLISLVPFIPRFSESKHYGDIIMSAMASQLTSLTIVYSNVYSGADQRNHQSSASPAFVRGIHRWPVNSPHKGPVTRKVFSFDDVIMGQLVFNKISRVLLQNIDITNREINERNYSICKQPFVTEIFNAHFSPLETKIEYDLLLV